MPGTEVFVSNPAFDLGCGQRCLALSRCAPVGPAGSAAARLGANASEQGGDPGFHVVVGAAVGPSVGGDRKYATQVAAVAPGPGKDAGHPVGALLEPESLGDVLPAEMLPWC